MAQLDLDKATLAAIHHLYQRCDAWRFEPVTEKPRAAVGISLTGYSMPIFWCGMMLIMLVSVQRNLTPVSGRVGEPGDFKDAVMHMILPAIVLGTIPVSTALVGGFSTAPVMVRG